LSLYLLFHIPLFKGNKKSKQSLENVTIKKHICEVGGKQKTKWLPQTGAVAREQSKRKKTLGK